jgi:endonuclease/exonuclease/phosphatase family metal-dependent hydrolase
MQIKVLSWNIWTDGQFDRVMEFLRTENADILGLQEVQADDAQRDTIGALRRLGYRHVFAPVTTQWQGRTWNDGPAIFSRREIAGSEVLALSPDAPQVAVRADIQIEGGVLHVFSMHLIHTHQRPSPVQDAQADALIRRLPDTRTVVMGDFNATPQSHTIQRMRQVLCDTDPDARPTWSVHPSGCPECNLQSVEIKLDYIFTSRDLMTHSYTVHESKASDHLPASVRIEL